MNKRYFYILLTVFLCAGCKPEANWETDDIQINMTIDKVSAGYVECSFSTNKAPALIFDGEERSSRGQNL